MSKRLAELREERNRIVTQARALLDKAETEKRDLSSDEQKQYDALMDEQQRKADSIKNEERAMDVERELAGQEIAGKRGAGDDKENRYHPRATEEYRASFTRFLLGGTRSLDADEIRALSAGSGPGGGFLVTPMQMIEDIIMAMDNEVFIREKATKFRVEKAEALGAASLDADPDDADWTSEIKTGKEDSGMAVGRRELHPHPLAKRIKISNKLLRLTPKAAALVVARLGYKFSVTQEKAYMVGSGNNQPLGIFTASAQGISTGRDIATDNTGTAITFDGLQNAKYSLKGQYQKRAEWLFHRDALRMIAKLKDLEGQYLWQPSKKDGEPDMLLGRPVNQSEYCPNTFTSGKYVGAFGDFSKYWIADALDMTIQVLTELYAENNQTGYIGRLETDGMPVLEEAFARVTLA